MNTSARPPPSGTPETAMLMTTARSIITIKYFYALITCIGVALACLPMATYIDQANIVMLFLLVVALVATFLGKGPAIAAAFLNVGLFDFLFVSPEFSFAVHDTQYLITFGVMLAVALIIGQLSGLLRKEVEQSHARELHIKALYDAASGLAGVMNREQVNIALQTCLANTLPGSAAILFLPTSDKHCEPLLPIAGRNALLDIGTVDLVYSTGILQETISGIPGHEAVYLPLRGSTRLRGVIAISMLKPSTIAAQERRKFLLALASLVVTTLERLHYVEVAQIHELEIREQRLRNAMLSALSHDLRTPLTVLCGMAETLMLMREQMPPGALQSLEALRNHAFRLENMVSNLLEMARLESGKIQPRLEWQPVEEVIGASIRLLGNQLAGHPVRVDVAQGMPLLNIDAVLMERVFCNLLENACKYSLPASPVTIQVLAQDGMAEFMIRNLGNGFPSADNDKLFNLFQRGADNTTTTGFGMGLAICKNIITLHGGHIEALNPPEGGACIRFTLPIGSPPALELPDTRVMQ